MSLLESIRGPRDLDDLSGPQMQELAGQIRTELIQWISLTGGHLGPNLGVVELSLALHRVFDSPRDTLLFDTGHQSYVHKLLTGRQGLGGMRQAGGLSGYPSRAESEHDLLESSHASSALSWAEGLSRARRLTGQGERWVVAVVGDGALTGGETWEALRLLCQDPDRRILLVINDNTRSYAPTVGDPVGDVLALCARHGIDVHAAVDGHDLPALERALRAAAQGHRFAALRVHTVKGQGHPPALADTVDAHHTVAPRRTQDGAQAPRRATFTTVAGRRLAALAEDDSSLVAVTAAMASATGLDALAATHPERVIDVGIAEAHALACSAGLAAGGLHPVVAIYSTFLTRGFDQALMDVGLHAAPVTLLVDRAGVTGPDGPSHHGLADLAMLGLVPGMQVAAPRDAITLEEELAEAVAIAGPSALRYPKGEAPEPLPALRRTPAGADVLFSSPGAEILLVAVGVMASLAVDVARRLQARSVAADVVDPRWVLPVAPELLRTAGRYRLLLVMEDGYAATGVGSRLAGLLSGRGGPDVLACGIPEGFLGQGEREQLLSEAGLEAETLTRKIMQNRRERT